MAFFSLSSFLFEGDAVGSDLRNTSHVDATASESSQNIIKRDTLSDMDVDVIVSRPFAVVDEIADGSPAAEDGLQLGDQIVKFGNVESGDNLLQRLSSESQASEGHALTLVAMRQGDLTNLKVTPRTWQGRGLLGYVIFFFLLICHCLFRSVQCLTCLFLEASCSVILLNDL